LFALFFFINRAAIRLIEDGTINEKEKPTNEFPVNSPRKMAFS